jgi:hypothetical protein
MGGNEINLTPTRQLTDRDGRAGRSLLSPCLPGPLAGSPLRFTVMGCAANGTKVTCGRQATSFSRIQGDGQLPLSAVAQRIDIFMMKFKAESVPQSGPRLTAGGRKYFVSCSAEGGYFTHDKLNTNFGSMEG